MINSDTYYLGLRTILKKWLFYKTYYSSISKSHIPSVRIFYKALSRLDRENYLLLYEKYILYSDFKVVENPITGKMQITNVVKNVSSKEIAEEKGIPPDDYRKMLVKATSNLEKHFKSLQGEEAFKNYEEYFMGDFVAYVNRNLKSKEYSVYFHSVPVLSEEEVESKAIDMKKLDMAL